MALNLNLRSSGFPSSPVAGRLPDDPYYKLARQAALPDTVARVARDAQMVAIPMRKLHEAQSAFESVDALMGSVSATAASGTSLVHDVVHAPLAPPQGGVPVPAPSHQEADPVPSEQAAHSKARPAADSLVVSDQADSEAWLQVVAPAACTEFRLAKKAINEAADAVGDEQAGLLAQAMESLRRALKKLADQLSPPNSSGEAISSWREAQSP